MWGKPMLQVHTVTYPELVCLWYLILMMMNQKLYPHSILFLLSTIYLVLYSVVSVLTPTHHLLLSFSRLIWALVSFSPHTARSRTVSTHLAPGCRVCLQVYPGLNRRRWVTCLWRSLWPASEVTLAGHTGMLRAPGASHCHAGNREAAGLWCEALALCCRAASGSRLSLGVWAFWNDTSLPEPHCLESLSNYTGRNWYKKSLM